MYIEQELYALKGKFENNQTRTDRNITILLKRIEQLESEIKELKSAR